MTTHNKRHGARQQPRQNSRPINIDEWKSRPGAANHQSTGAVNTPAILAQLTRREKQALVLWAILEDQMTDARLDSMVDVITRSNAARGPSGKLSSLLPVADPEP